uniref:Uncharacterized protein n=1 Tax=Oryza nivara TaxID=4536 RepID=A0A0E0G4Z7_ORYNI
MPGGCGGGARRSCGADDWARAAGLPDPASGNDGDGRSFGADAGAVRRLHGQIQLGGGAPRLLPRPSPLLPSQSME